MSDRLILEIEVPEFNVDGAQEDADAYLDGNVLYIVTEEWMRDDVIVVVNDIPGEKMQNHEFEIHALEGRIVGARIVSNPAKSLDEDFREWLVDQGIQPEKLTQREQADLAAKWAVRPPHVLSREQTREE